MELEALKIRTQEIKGQYVGKPYVKWPVDFKKEVFKSGVWTKEVAKSLNISSYSVFDPFFLRESRE